MSNSTGGCRSLVHRSPTSDLDGRRHGIRTRAGRARRPAALHRRVSRLTGGERRSAGTFSSKKDANAAWQRAEAKAAEGRVNDLCRAEHDGKHRHGRTPDELSDQTGAEVS